MARQLCVNRLARSGEVRGCWAPVMRSDDADDAHHRRDDAHHHRTAPQGRRIVIVADDEHAGVMG
ncbi:MAG TPA: hypothetical protein VFE80_09485, partial [Beijerinckiaceae bacterium]|nr:hypothetical protein [Beijerinckiaceae bacterium]